MSSTEGLHPKTVAMLQGSSHLRVQSSAEFKMAAGSIPILEFERCTGKTGNVSNRGVSVILSTADVSLDLGRPQAGYWKRLIFQCKKATSCIQEIRPTSKGIKFGVGSSETKVTCSSFTDKHKVGAHLDLLGYDTGHWMIMARSTTDAVVFTFTSDTG